MATPDCITPSLTHRSGTLPAMAFLGGQVPKAGLLGKGSSSTSLHDSGMWHGRVQAGKGPGCWTVHCHQGEQSVFPPHFSHPGGNSGPDGDAHSFQVSLGI